jgi:hypothetical protein
MTEPRTLSEALRKLHPAQALNTRQKVLDELLTHYRTAEETLWSGQGYDATDMAGVRGMPAVWTRSYRELEGLLKKMRNQGQQKAVEGFSLQTLYWHLAEWYLRSEVFPQWPKKYSVQRGRETIEVRPPVRMVLRRHKDVRPARVKLALDWLDAEWTSSVQPRVGEPMVPDEIMQAHLPGDDVIREKVRAA